MKFEYDFKNPKLSETAYTHISFAKERKVESNQRLEFFGDSILSFIVAEILYHKYPECDEGMLTKMRAEAVCEKTLALAAKEIGLGDGIVYGKSEIHQKRDRASILADTYEAYLAAIYLDGGIDAAKEWVKVTLGDKLENLETEEVHNYKSEVQSYFQKRNKNCEVVNYRLVKKDGPDHAPSFVVEALYLDKVIGGGSGKTRKQAEQNAAKDAMEKLGVL